MSGAKKKAERRALAAQAGMTEREKQELKAQQIKKRNTILAIVGGVVAVILIAALLLWNSGIFARMTTALTVKDHKFSVADMDYYYHQVVNRAYSNEQYMAQIYAQSGMEYEPQVDFSADLKTQYVDEEQTQSYYDYFKEQTKEDVAQICALYDAAKAANYQLSEEAQASLDKALDDLDEIVSEHGFGSRGAYLKAVYGKNVTEGVYMDNLKMNVLASDYYSSITGETRDYTDDELKAYYKDNADKLDCYDYDYVYFDGSSSSVDDEGNAVEASEEEKAAAMSTAKAKAEGLVTAWNAAKDATPAEDEAPATFISVASGLGASATPRSGVSGSNFATAPYAEWMMDPARKDGDFEKFELEGAGWYVIQFHDRYLDDDPTMDVRHILLSTTPEDDPETEDVDESRQEPTEERVAEVKAKAQEILDEFNAGEKTAEAFGELAEKYSADGRDENGDLYTAGGLYEKITKGQMVQPFEDWCFAGHKPGDTGLVQTTYGWHVMYFQAENRPAWMDQANSAKQTADQEAMMDGIQEGYEAVEGSGWADVGRS